MQRMEPFLTQVDASGALQPRRAVYRRHLSDMQKHYADQAALQRILEQEGDRLIYEVQTVPLPLVEGQILHGTTRLTPGTVGGEFHMTKGHYHARREQGEVYFGLQGQGLLLLQTEDGTTRELEMLAGSAAYVPPYWGHRAINVGAGDFVFFSVWEARAGQDYASIERDGFYKLVLAGEAGTRLVDRRRG